MACRPPSKEEIAQRTPQVVKCVEAAREVTLLQNQGGKSLGRTYHFDKVRIKERCPPAPRQQLPERFATLASHLRQAPKFCLQVLHLVYLCYVFTLPSAS